MSSERKIPKVSVRKVFHYLIWYLLFYALVVEYGEYFTISLRPGVLITIGLLRGVLVFKIIEKPRLVPSIELVILELIDATLFGFFEYYNVFGIIWSFIISLGIGVLAIVDRKYFR